MVSSRVIANKVTTQRYPISGTPVPGVLEWRFHRQGIFTKLPIGTAVEHKTFGRGVVESLEVEDGRIGIRFVDVGFKKLTLTEIFRYITLA
jgi:hypothetical protein